MCYNRDSQWYLCAVAEDGQSEAPWDSQNCRLREKERMLEEPAYGRSPLALLEGHRSEGPC